MFLLAVLLVAHGLISLQLGYHPWDGLDRADKGIAFDVATAAGFSLLGLAQIRWLPLPLHWIRRLVVLEVLGLGLFLFVDFIYFTQFRTHIPFSTLEYLGPNHRFALTLLDATFSWGFLCLVLIPSLLWVVFAHLLVRFRPGWFLEPMRLPDLAVWSSLLVIFGVLPLLGSLNLNPPLTSNGPVYFLWSYNFEDETRPADLLSDQKNVTSSLSGRRIRLSKTYPLVRRKSARGCRRTTMLSEQLCRQQRPNILFVFVKSLRANEVQPLGSPLNLTPGLNRLSKKGILFSRFFANGVDSRHALVASLCSMLPNQGAPALKKYQDRQLFCLPQLLNKRGYHSSVVTGQPKTEDQQWEKLGFTEVVEASHLKTSPFSPGSGVSDRELYGQLLDHLSKTPKPFFTAAFSQSNQYPFEVPKVDQIYGAKDKKHQYLESVHYTDAQVYRLVQLARTQVWWKHTLIFIFGETGNNQPPVQTPKDTLGWVNLYSQVPLLIVGGPVKRAIEIRSTHDQLDLAPTVADLLRIPYNAPFAGTSILSKKHQLAFSIRPGNYHAAWDNHGAVVLEKGGAFHHKPGMNSKDIESLLFLSNSWVRLQPWLLQQDRIWPKEAP